MTEIEPYNIGGNLVLVSPYTRSHLAPSLQAEQARMLSIVTSSWLRMHELYKKEVHTRLAELSVIRAQKAFSTALEQQNEDLDEDVASYIRSSVVTTKLNLESHAREYHKLQTLIGKRRAGYNRVIQMQTEKAGRSTGIDKEEALDAARTAQQLKRTLTHRVSQLKQAHRETTEFLRDLESIL